MLTIFFILTELVLLANSYSELITFIANRPAQDMRYAIEASKIKNDLGWVPYGAIESGIRKTVQWYLSNQSWCQETLDSRPKRVTGE